MLIRMCNITVSVPGNQDNIGDDRGQASADSLVVVIVDPDPGRYSEFGLPREVFPNQVLPTPIFSRARKSSQWSCAKILATRRLPAYRLRQNYDYGTATA
jgi:hypothetical protein